MESGNVHVEQSGGEKITAYLANSDKPTIESPVFYSACLTNADVVFQSYDLQPYRPLVDMINHPCNLTYLTLKISRQHKRGEVR